MSRLNPSGFIVLEWAAEFEQVLSLDLSKDKPAGGVLACPGKGVSETRVFFPTRAAARAAIKRTEHYRLAFGDSKMPESANCRIELIALVEDPA